MFEISNGYRILEGKHFGKRSLRKPRRKWYDNIKIDRAEMGCEGGRWTEAVQDRVQCWDFVQAVLNLQVLLPAS
jgi:hypothetical protein